LFPIATLGVTAALWFIRRKSRGPLAAWLFFVGTLFPVLGFLNVYPFLYSYVADHFQYLASLGLIVLAAAGITRGLARMSHNSQSLGVGLCMLWVATLAVLTLRQSQTYANSVTLYEATLERNPNCWMAHYNLACDLRKVGREQEAINHFRRVTDLKPNHVE